MLRLENFILCREASTTPNGNINLGNLIPGMIMAAGVGHNPALALDVITAVVVIDGLQGINQFEQRWDITVDGQIILATPTATATRPPDADIQTLINVFQPFPAPKVGSYVIRLTITLPSGGSLAFTKVLEIRAFPNAPAPAPTPTPTATN